MLSPADTLFSPSDPPQAQPPQRQPLGQLRPAQAQFKSPNVMLDHMLLGWRTPAKRLWRQELGRGAAPPPRPGAQLHVI